MKKTAQLLLLLLLSIAPLSAKEKLLDMNKFELVPPPKEDSFQKYQLNENIVFGTDIEKKARKDGSGIYYNGTNISFELLRDDDFTLLEDVYFDCCPKFYFEVSDDFGNSVFYKYNYSSISGMDIEKHSGKLDNERLKLKMVKEGKKLSFYINDKLMQLDDSKEMEKLERIQYIKQIIHLGSRSDHFAYNIFIFKD